MKSMNEKKRRNKKIRAILILIMLFQLIGFCLGHLQWFGENTITRYLAQLLEAINSYLTPSPSVEITSKGIEWGYVHDWKYTLQAIRESEIYKKLCVVLRWAIPFALAGNLLEARLRRLIFKVTCTPPTSGLLPKYKNVANEAFLNRPKGPVIEYRKLCAVRVQTFGAHHADNSALLSDGIPHVLPDGNCELHKRDHSIVATCDSEDFTLDKNQLIVTHHNSAGTEVLSHIITPL